MGVGREIEVEGRKTVLCVNKRKAKHLKHGYIWKALNKTRMIVSDDDALPHGLTDLGQGKTLGQRTCGNIWRHKENDIRSQTERLPPIIVDWCHAIAGKLDKFITK